MKIFGFQLPEFHTINQPKFRMACVFLLYQPLGYGQTLQLLVDRRPVRHLKTPAASAVGAGIEQPGQAGVIHLIRWRQIQLQHLGAAEQLMHAADTKLIAAVDNTAD